MSPCDDALSFSIECLYHYVHQPPQDVNCDPYGTESTGVSLRCQVIADESSSHYSVAWFYIPPNSSTPRQIMFTSTLSDNISSSASVVTSTYTLRPSQDGNSAGLYYCQVLPNDDQMVETVPSDSFRLFAPNDNHYVPTIHCDASIPRFTNEIRCAQAVDQGTPSTTGLQTRERPTNSVSGKLGICIII